MTQNIFRGLGIALITPFNNDGSVDYASLKRLIEYQICNGADFLCILATTSEVPCLTKEEKDKITELVKEVNHERIPILKYCGGNNTAAVVEEIRNTDWSGIDGILSICPYYNKPSQEGLYQHFKAIAQASPLPVVMYNVPGRTGVNMKAETTCRIAHDFPNIVGIKEASGSLEQVETAIYLYDYLVSSTESEIGRLRAEGMHISKDSFMQGAVSALSRSTADGDTDKALAAIQSENMRLVQKLIFPDSRISVRRKRASGGDAWSYQAGKGFGSGLGIPDGIGRRRIGNGS